MRAVAAGSSSDTAAAKTTSSITMNTSPEDHMSILPRPTLVVVMGVCGSGKSSMARRLADLLCAEFIEGDDLHPSDNVAKMAAGRQLTDEDRWPWLDSITERLRSNLSNGRSSVVSCSALKRSYRDRLRTGARADLAFVFLDGEREVLAARMAKRSAHFMPTSLLDSQLQTLERPTGEPNVVTLDIAEAPEVLAGRAFDSIAACLTVTARPAIAAS